MEIEINKLVPNDYNPRLLFHGASMDELTGSIKENGLIEPLVVKALKDGKYRIVCGMRRYHALKMNKAKTAECYVREFTDAEEILVSLIENIQRENLTPMEESRAYAINLGINFESFLNLENFFAKGKGKNGKIPKFANKIGKSATTVYSRLHLLFLPKPIQEILDTPKSKFLMYASELVKLRKIGKEDLAHRFMMNIYDEYKAKPNAFSLDDVNKRVTKLLDKYKEDQEEKKEDISIQIKVLKQKISETEDARAKVIIKYNDDILDFYKTFADQKVDTDDEDLLVEGFNILDILEGMGKKYSDNREYESIVERINIIENNISNSYLLIEKVKKDNIRVCPYCHGLINTEIIERDVENYQTELEVLKEKRGSIAGIENDIVKIKTNISRDINAIQSKDKFIESFESDMELLKSGN